MNMRKKIIKKITLHKSFFSAAALHLGVLLLVILSFTFAPKAVPPQSLSFKQADKIINATSVNPSKVQQEISRLKSEQAAKERQEKARLAKLRDAENKALEAKKAQEAALEKLKVEQAMAKEKAEAELAALNAKKALAEKQLAQTKPTPKTPPAPVKKTTLSPNKNALQDEAMADLQKEIAQEQTQLEQQKASQVNDEIQKYTLLMLQAMQQNWVYPPNINSNLYCILEIKLAENGDVVSVNLKKSSGNPMLDQSAIAAVYKSSPLPMSSNPDVFQKMRDINLKAIPQEQIT
jgi:colicin import membrane protein